MNRNIRTAAAGVRLKRPYYELCKNLLLDFVSVRFHLRQFYPLMTNIYITKRCNLRCQYCYPPGHEPDMTGEQGLALLEKIRPGCPAINFTGGEPLLHPHLGRFLKKARQLRFRPVLVSTNSYQTGPLNDNLALVDNVIVSLDSLDEQINDRLSGVPGATREIIANIRRLSGLRRRFGFNLSIHTVMCADNLEEIDRIVDFCDQYQIALSVSPQHIDAYPCKDFADNELYVAAIRRLKQLKRAGKPIACSVGYLDKIERFSRHRCFPFLSPRIEPDGSIFFPCYRIRKRTCNLLDYPDLLSLMRQESERMDGYGDCHVRCFLACYLEVEEYVRNPLHLVREVPFRKLALGPGRRAVDEGHSSTAGFRNG